MTDTHSDTAAATPSQAATVHRVDAKNRYEIQIDGQVAGFAAYRDKAEQRVFYHTEINKAFTGRGLSTILISQALTDARNTGKRIIPVCPLVAAFLEKHHEFDDVTQRATPEILQWLDSVMA